MLNSAASVRPRRSSLLLLISLLLVVCKQKPTIPPDVVVRVNERMVSLSDFKRYLERNAGTDLAQLTPEVSSALLDQFIEEVILSEYAAAHGAVIPSDKVAEAVRAEAGATVMEKRDEMRREKLLADLSAEIPESDEPELRTYYESHQSDFRSGEEVRVRQILVSEEALAADILKKLRSGADFGELSAAHSLAANARRGGEIGYVSRGDLPKMFEEVIFGLAPGSVSDVIRTDSGFFIFRVDERRPPGMVDFDSARPLIQARLREEKLRERLNKVIADSRRQMSIAVLTRRLPFQYSGALPKASDE